ncbi:MAG: cytochrome P450 [Bradyrhizobium sp.]|uniref:cytochrome P450/oxidoreductase n=1 Tax=Bradyrhizobium sp. TaxID=376 RepID=UPI0025C72C38|nr:cytochrome P450/oxidoreductase [Bradyrhizobium sp.]MBI5263111.1 cytochrome P450 [Bradyrhizobium sp.]
MASVTLKEGSEVAASACPVHAGPAEPRSPTGCPVSSRAAEFDPFEGPYQLDPAEALRWAREEEPVFYSPRLGYWVVTRYEDVKAVFRDNILFSPSIALEKITPAPPEAEAILKSYGYALTRTMVNEDEPAHMERRRVLLESFAPEALATHEPSIRALTRQYMDRFIDKGRADLVAEMFWEIPLTVAMHFLGVKDDDIEQLRRYCVAHTLNTWGRPTREEQLQVADSVGKFWQLANRILDAMMADPRGEGWMYFSIRQHLKFPDVVPLSYLRSMMMAILAAAHETTSNATANAFRLLLSNREVWEEICESPALIPNAVEECLRRAGSIVAWRRLVTADTRIGEVEIPKGAKLMIVMASANHDQRHFENPLALDLYRENCAEHLSFGYGAHQCMGKNIARMEMRIFLEEFVKRLPHMELVPQDYKYLPNIAFRGPDSLWVKWDPARNPERTDPSILSRQQSFKIGAPLRAGIVRQMRVAAVEPAADGVLRYVLEHPHGRPLPPWSPGSHIDFCISGYERKYSLCGDPSDRMRYEVAILKEEQGRGGSKFIHEQIKAGSVIPVRGPKNHFRMDEDASNYVLIAGGIGITPIIAMADHLKQLGKPHAVHYAGRSPISMCFVERLKRDHGANLFLYDKSQGERMDLRQLTGQVGPGTQVYACGPERLLAELEELARGWPENTLHVEHFSAAGSLLDPEHEHGFDVELKDSNLTIRVAPDQTVLQSLQAAGIDVACDCQEGLCGSCEVQVQDGEIDHRDKVLTQGERARNNRMMVCCSRARGGKLTLSL